MMLAAETSTLPDNTGYVAAAYLVFIALIVIYLAIIAIRVARTEREIVELNEVAARREGSDHE